MAASSWCSVPVGARPPGAKFREMGTEEPPSRSELLQVAALELIGAARAFLDAAERVVQDPKALSEVAAALATVAKSAIGSVLPRTDSAAPDGDGEPGGIVEHIDVR
jgi:hypothetical protein